MTKQIFIAGLFFLSIMIELSLIHAFNNVLAVIPFHLIVGIIVLHRAGNELGALWFIATAILAPWLGFELIPGFVYLVIALVGPLLTARVFTTRSIYALEGLGFSLFSISLLTNFFLSIFNRPFSLGHQLYALAFLVIGLYLGFFVARLLERISAQFIVLQKVQS